MLKCIIIDDLSTIFKNTILISEKLILIKYSLKEYNQNSLFFEEFFDCVIRVINIENELVSDLNFNVNKQKKIILIPIKNVYQINLLNDFKEKCQDNFKELYTIRSQKDNIYFEKNNNIYYEKNNYFDLYYQFNDLLNDLHKINFKKKIEYDKPIILKKDILNKNFIIFFQNTFFEVPFSKMNNVNYKISDIYNIQIEKNQIVTHYKDKNNDFNRDINKEYDLIIFGANGFIGSKIVEEAEKKGLKILKISRSIINGLKVDSRDLEKYKNELRNAKAIVIAIGSPPIHHKLTKLSLDEQISKNGYTNSKPIKGAEETEIEKIFLVNVKIPTFINPLFPGYVKGKQIAEDALLQAFGIPDRYIFKTSVVHNNQYLQKYINKIYDTKIGNILNEYLGKPVTRLDIANYIIQNL